MTKKETLNQSGFDFESDLSINKYQLDKECLSHAALYFRYADACQQAKSNVSKLDDALKLVMADRNIAIRKAYTDKGQKFTEAVIASELERDEEVLNAKQNLRDAQEVYGRLSVAVQAMDARRSELDNLVTLYKAGYFASSKYDNSKMDINEDVGNQIRKNLNKE